MKTVPKNLALSLNDLLGREFTEAVCSARAFASGEDTAALRALADEKVDFYPESYSARVDELLDSVG